MLLFFLVICLNMCVNEFGMILCSLGIVRIFFIVNVLFVFVCLYVKIVFEKKKLFKLK